MELPDIILSPWTNTSEIGRSRSVGFRLIPKVFQCHHVILVAKRLGFCDGPDDGISN